MNGDIADPEECLSFRCEAEKNQQGTVVVDCENHEQAEGSPRTCERSPRTCAKNTRASDSQSPVSKQSSSNTFGSKQEDSSEDVVSSRSSRRRSSSTNTPSKSRIRSISRRMTEDSSKQISQRSLQSRSSTSSRTRSTSATTTSTGRSISISSRKTKDSAREFSSRSRRTSDINGLILVFENDGEEVVDPHEESSQQPRSPKTKRKSIRHIPSDTTRISTTTTGSRNANLTREDKVENGSSPRRASRETKETRRRSSLLVSLEKTADVNNEGQDKSSHRLTKEPSSSSQRRRRSTASTISKSGGRTKGSSRDLTESNNDESATRDEDSKIRRRSSSTKKSTGQDDKHDHSPTRRRRRSSLDDLSSRSSPRRTSTASPRRERSTSQRKTTESSSQKNSPPRARRTSYNKKGDKQSDASEPPTSPRTRQKSTNRSDTRRASHKRQASSHQLTRKDDLKKHPRRVSTEIKEKRRKSSILGKITDENNDDKCSLDHMEEVSSKKRRSSTSTIRSEKPHGSSRELMEDNNEFSSKGTETPKSSGDGKQATTQDDLSDSLLLEEKPSTSRSCCSVSRITKRRGPPTLSITTAGFMHDAETGTPLRSEQSQDRPSSGKKEITENKTESLSMEDCQGVKGTSPATETKKTKKSRKKSSCESPKVDSHYTSSSLDSTLSSSEYSSSFDIEEGYRRSGQSSARENKKILRRLKSDLSRRAVHHLQESEKHEDKKEGKKGAHEGTCWRGYSRYTIATAFACFFCMFGSVGIVMLFAAEDSESSQTLPPTTPEETVVQGSERLESLVSLIGPIVSSTPAVFVDHWSPQFKAITWLADEDPASFPIDEAFLYILIERYAAMVLYFSNGLDADLKGNYNFQDEHHICTWHNHDGIGLYCEGEPWVSKILLRKCEMLRVLSNNSARQRAKYNC
jgi:hypothetical protein